MEITGRITADAVVSTTKSDKQVVNFNIAINDRYQTKSGEKREITEFVRCAYWIGTGIAKVLTKGTLVQVFGRISTQAWQGSDGEPKASLQFHTSNIKILGGGKRGMAEETPQDSNGHAPTQDKNDDLPF
jgi:single-strand DNA-binding protein